MSNDPPRWLRLMRAAARKAVVQGIKIQAYFMATVFGPEHVVNRLSQYARWTRPTWILRFLGATVGERCNIDPNIRIQNARHGRCENLTIGEHVYIAPNCLFDLANRIVIEDEAAVGAGTSVITHLDCGDRPQRTRFPRREGPVLVGRGSWISVNVTILHGTTVGENSLVGACALVREDVPANTLAVGIPARVVRTFQDDLAGENAR